MKENWYILFALAEKQEQVCNVIRNQGLHAFLPMMEYYRRDRKAIEVKPMFPGYIFVRTQMQQQDFDQMLFSLGDQKHGLIRQLKREGSTAMRKSEIEFFRQLLTEDGISKMSYGYLQNKKAVITEGAIRPFQDKIVKVDRHNKIAWLDFEFMNRQIQSGLWLNQKYESQQTEENKDFRYKTSEMKIQNQISKMREV